MYRPRHDTYSTYLPLYEDKRRGRSKSFYRKLFVALILIVLAFVGLACYKSLGFVRVTSTNYEMEFESEAVPDVPMATREEAVFHQEEAVFQKVVKEHIQRSSQPLPGQPVKIVLSVNDDYESTLEITEG